jgi:hypothetical protein
MAHLDSFGRRLAVVAAAEGGRYQKKRPGFCRDAFCALVCWDSGYCVGLNSCVNPVVFTSRKSGVRGGSSEGCRKLLSKV